MQLPKWITHAKVLALPQLKARLRKHGFVHRVYQGDQIFSNYQSHDKTMDQRVRNGEFSQMHIFTLPVAEAFRRQFRRPSEGFEHPEHEEAYKKKLVQWAYQFENVRKDTQNHVGKLIFSWGKDPHGYFNYFSPDGVKLPHLVGVMTQLPDHYHVIILVGKDPKALEKERKQREKEKQTARGTRKRP